jgi:uncharacterized phiE125 gp8 family phage protein
MALKLITPQVIEPVTLEEAKSHCRIDDNSEDFLITSLIVAAREYCESFQNRAYITQTWQLWLDSWPAGSVIPIPRPPLQSVVDVKYYDTNDTEHALAAADYFVDNKSDPGRLILKAWPAGVLRPTNGVCVEFTAGYGDDAEAVPQKVKQAMLLLIGHWYENREAAIAGTISREIEFAVRSLLWLDRVVPI